MMGVSRNGCWKCVIYLFWKREYFLLIKGDSNMYYLSSIVPIIFISKPMTIEKFKM